MANAMTMGLDESNALKLVRGLHDMAADDDFLARFVNDYTGQLGADAIQIFGLDKERTPLFMAATSAYEHVAGQYFPYEASDPRTHFLAHRAGRVFSCVEMAPMEEMERAPAIAEFLDRPDIGLRWTVGGKFHLSDGATAFVAILRARTRGPFVDEARAPADVIFPHLTELTRTRLAVSQAQLWQATLESALDNDDRAIVVVTADGRIVHANGAGETLFRRGDIFRSRTGYIGMAAEGQAGGLRRAIAAKAAERDSLRLGPSLLPVYGAGGEIACVVRLWLLPAETGPLGRIGPFVQLTIERLRGDIRLLPETRHLFGLSRREFEMAEALCSRETTANAAARLGISHETARGYVKALLVKLGVSSQKDAVAALTRFTERS